MEPTEPRAEDVRIPKATRAYERAMEKRQKYIREREWLERRSMVRGLVWLAMIALVASVVRAGVGRAFVGGWWHP